MVSNASLAAGITSADNTTTTIAVKNTGALQYADTAILVDNLTLDAAAGGQGDIKGNGKALAGAGATWLMCFAFP